MVQRRFFSIAAISGALALAAVAPAQAWTWNWNSEQVRGSGEVVSEQRDLGSFDAVSMSGGFVVTVRQSRNPKVEVRTDRNLQSLLETRVVESGKGRTLEIAPKKGYNISGSVRPQIFVDLPELRAVTVGGSGDIKVEAMKGGRVDASVGGSGDIKFAQLEAEQLVLSVAGSGDISASGSAQVLKLSVAGSGDVHAREMQADEVKASIAGSGSAQVNARKTLNISIAGSGDIGYVGNPQVSSSVAGSGRIKKLD